MADGGLVLCMLVLVLDTLLGASPVAAAAIPAESHLGEINMGAAEDEQEINLTSPEVSLTSPAVSQAQGERRELSQGVVFPRDPQAVLARDFDLAGGMQRFQEAFAVHPNHAMLSTTNDYHNTGKVFPSTTGKTPKVFRVGGVFGYWRTAPHLPRASKAEMSGEGSGQGHTSLLVPSASWFSSQTTDNSVTTPCSPLSLSSVGCFFSSLVSDLADSLLPYALTKYMRLEHSTGYFSQPKPTTTMSSEVSISKVNPNVVQTVIGGGMRAEGERGEMSDRQMILRSASHSKGGEGGSVRRRRWVENTSVDVSSTPERVDEASSVSADLTSSTPVGWWGGKEGSEASTSPSALEHSTPIPLSSTVEADVPSAECGRGGNWSCRGRCGHPPSLPCSCDALCELTEHCCEDFRAECSLGLSPALSALKERQVRCSKGYMLVSDCPKEWAGNETESRCRRKRSDVMEDVWPVSSVATGVAFANVHCALCNGVADVAEWQALADCLVVGDTFADLLHDCKFHFSPPEGYSAQQCITGGQHAYHWRCPQNSDPFLEKKCNQFYSHVVTTTDDYISLRIFKNRYCKACFFDIFSSEKWLCSSFLPREQYHGGNFMALMRWSAGGAMEMTVKSKELDYLPTLSWQKQCDERGFCLDTECHNGSIMYQGYCTFEFFKASVVLQFASETYVKRERDFLLDHFSVEMSANPDLNNICPGFMRKIVVENDMLYISMQCKVEELAKMDESESKRLLPSVLDETIASLTTPAKNLTYGCLIWKPISDSCTDITRAKSTAGGILGMDSSLVKAERYLGLTGSSLSVLALSVRVALQFFVPHFRSVPARLQLCLAVSLLLAYLGFLSGAEVSPATWGCWAVAVLTHAAFLTSFLWMNVFVFHLWRSLARVRSVAAEGGARGAVLGPATYCFLLCLPLMAPAVTLDLVLPEHKLSPRYARPGCWFNSGWGLLVFFAVPSLLICAVNLVLVLLTLRLVYRQRMRQWEEVVASPLVEVRLAVRLVALTGATWLAGLAAGLADVGVLWLVFTLLNSLMGFGVGLNLVVNRRNLRFFRQKFQDATSRSSTTEISKTD